MKFGVSNGRGAEDESESLWLMSDISFSAG